MTSPTPKVAAPPADGLTVSSGTPTLTRRAPIRRPRYNLADRPFIVIWELTRACDLACRHCRAQAQPERQPDELTTGEGFSLIGQIAGLGRPRPVFTITGGDPLKRPDLVDLVAFSSSSGLPVSIAPSVTPLLSSETVSTLRAAGMATIALSLDGSRSDIHDGFRGVPGSFDESIAAIEMVKSQGVRLQINTTVTPHNFLDLADLACLVHRFTPVTWSLFFLVPTGRAVDLPHLSADESEDVLHFLYDAAKQMPVKLTEAPHYRRVVIQRQILEDKYRDARRPAKRGLIYHTLRTRFENLMAEGSSNGARGKRTGGRIVDDQKFRHPSRTLTSMERGGSTRSSVKRPPMTISSGQGFVFVSHTGDVYPSGFLPLRCGNIREEALIDIYRNSPLLQALRDPRKLQGRCGLCEFRSVCGGSRSRAFGVAGNPLAEEPWCNYVPGSFPDQERVRDMLGHLEA